MKINKEFFIYLGVIAVLIIYVFYLFSQITVTADFEELEPFKHKLPVYYKGFRLGHTGRIYPSKDYHSTYVDLKIRLKDLELPLNTEAMVRRKDKKEYIELIYPDAPYVQSLKNGSLIAGKKGIHFEHYIEEQVKNGGLDEIKGNVNITIASAGDTFKALTEMINVLTGILEDVRPTINETVENVNFASKNIADASLNVRSSLQQGYIDNSLQNLEKVTNNLAETTYNFSGVAGRLNNTSINLINCILRNVNVVVGNVNEIIVGVGNTLKKRFGAMRLFFGKTMSN